MFAKPTVVGRTKKRQNIFSPTFFGGNILKIVTSVPGASATSVSSTRPRRAVSGTRTALPEKFARSSSVSRTTVSRDGFR
jgi:hypothetical protein